MTRTLLVGNGINRCINDDFDCKALMKAIDKNNKLILSDDISFSMQFEILANKINKMNKENKTNTDKTYDDLKDDLIKNMLDIEMNDLSIHKKLCEKFDCILTTNYDYNLEKSLDESFKYTKKYRQGRAPNKYCVNDFNFVVKGKEFYHIHGFADKINTICLGYEHYAGMVQKLREKLTSHKKDKPKKIVEFLNDGCFSLNTWATKFFKDDIHIIGFGLADCEIDIWWLLIYRSYLIRSNYKGCGDLIKNKIYYHDITKDKDENKKSSEETNNKQKSSDNEKEPINKMDYLLTSLDVKYKYYQVEGEKTFKYWYEYIINEEIK